MAQTNQEPNISILDIREDGPLVAFTNNIEALRPGLDLFRAGDYVAAIATLEPLADAGNAAAQNALGVFLTDNDGPLAPFYDPTRGFAYYTASADAGFARAYHNLGLFYGKTHAEIAPNEALAFEWFERAVNVDYRESFYDYARLLANGTGTSQDTARARDYAERALETSTRAAALSLLADFAYYGEGEPVDMVKSLRLFEESAAGGEAYGAWSAGYQYYFGEGAEVDDAKARIYFEQAIAGGEYNASGYLAEIYFEGYDVPADQSRAIEIARAGDDAGDGYASAYLGQLYVNSGNFQAAREAYTRASERGDSEGLYQLGDLAYFGEGETQDYAKAYELYEASVKAFPTQADALYSIGYMKMRGEGTPVDLVGAVAFLERALEQDSWAASAEVPILFGHPDYDGAHSDPVRAMAWCYHLSDNDFDFDADAADETKLVCETLPEQLSDSAMAEARAWADTL